MANPEKEMSEKEQEERASAHPMAVPFLWLGRESVIKNFIWLPLIGIVLTTVMSFANFRDFDPHHLAPWDFFASWVFIGFFAYSIVVLSAGPLFRLLARDENYYGEGGLPDPDVSTEGSHDHD